jgi:hypothetical protein
MARWFALKEVTQQEVQIEWMRGVIFTRKLPNDFTKVNQFLIKCFMVLSLYKLYGTKWIYGVRPTKRNGRFRIHAKKLTLRNDNLIEEVGGVASFVNILSEDLNKCTIVGRVLTPLENEP